MRAISNVCMLAAVATFAALGAGPAAADVTGENIPSTYGGFLVASQVNATGFGNHLDISEQGILVGNELDALYVTADATDLWIGIPGNLPNKLGASQSIVLLFQFNTAVQASPSPNILLTAGLPGYGGGYQALLGLDGTVLEPYIDAQQPGFAPDSVVVVNRFAETTYVDSWYLPQNTADPYFDNFVGEDPYNGRYMSAYMDTTNIVGVDADETKDGAQQQALAVGAQKGLRLRLERSYYGIGTSFKMLAILMSSDGVVSNQILPPLSTVDDPAAPNCVGYSPNFDETYFDPETQTFGLLDTQFATIDLTTHVGTPTDFDGSDIPAQWPSGSLIAVQQIHTCFGDAVPGTLEYTVNGSELDELFVRTDEQFLHLAYTGNLERNGNKLIIWVDSDPAAGENVLDNNGGSLTGWEGRTLDAGFAPDHAYVMNNWQDTLYVDRFELATNTATYLGASAVGGGSGVLTGGTNPANDLFAFKNTNNAGVVGIGDPGAPGIPSTATTGLEARIALSELGITEFGRCTTLKVWVIQAGGGGEYLSNQCLPSFAPDTNYNIEGEYGDPPPPKFNFGSLDPLVGGDPAFDGDQFATVKLLRLGDVFDDPDCCINLNDLAQFVQVLLGNVTDARSRFLSDMNADGAVNGSDIQLFVDRLLAEGPCP